jgi:hypothetical protein
MASLIDILLPPNRKRLQRDAGGTRGRFGRTELNFADRRVPEHRQARDPRHRLHQQLDLLAPELGNIQEESREIASRASNAVDEPASYRIGFEIDADDRNRLRRLRHCLDRIRVAGEDDAALEADELASDLVEMLERASVKSGIDPHVLSLDISGVAQPPEKTLGILVPGSMNGTDPRKLGRRLLPPRRERPRRRAAKQCDEFAPS